jgi:hypothetical protein
MMTDTLQVVHAAVPAEVSVGQLAVILSASQYDVGAGLPGHQQSQ